MLQASKPARTMPRAWKSSRSCNWLHSQLPIEHRNFRYARKIRKIDFDENSRLEPLRRQLLCCRHQNRLAPCHEHGNQAGVAIGCIRSSRWSTGIFDMQEKSEKSILMKIRVWSACDDSCYAAGIKTGSHHATSMEIKQELQVVALAAPDGAQEFSICKKNQKNRF